MMKILLVGIVIGGVIGFIVGIFLCVWMEAIAEASEPPELNHDKFQALHEAEVSTGKPSVQSRPAQKAQGKKTSSEAQA